MRCLSMLNKALLCKWSWHFIEERGVLRKKVTSGKYGEDERGWSSREMRHGHGVGLWKAIRKE